MSGPTSWIYHPPHTHTCQPHVPIHHPLSFPHGPNITPPSFIMPSSCSVFNAFCCLSSIQYTNIVIVIIIGSNSSNSSSSRRRRRSHVYPHPPTRTHMSLAAFLVCDVAPPTHLHPPAPT